MRALMLPGLADYAATLALQEALVQARIAGRIGDVVLLLEHANTLTVGRARDAEAGLTAPGDWPVIRVPRGGSVTWHGPGQLVAYPIVQLVGARQDLHRHLHALEDAVIATLAELGLNAGTDPRNTGAWLDCPDGARRKVCSIGIGCKRWVTWHGLALNIRPDLASFSRIQPCGFEPDVMCSLAQLISAPPTLPALAAQLLPHLGAALDLPVDGPPIPLAEISEHAALVALGASA